MTAQKPKTAKTIAKPKKPVKPGHGKNSKEARFNAFVEHYFANGQNGRQAALAVGFSPASADNAAWRLLKNPQVLQRIEQRQNELAQKLELTTENTLRSLAQAIHFDPRKLYNADGSLKAVIDLDDDTAMALAGFEMLEEYAGRGEDRALVGFTKKVKWLDKNAARDQANKILGLYKKDNEQPNAAVAAALSEANKIDKLKAKFAQVLAK